MSRSLFQKILEEDSIAAELFYAREKLSKHTTLKVGGEAELFAKPKTLEELENIIAICSKYSIKWRMLGRGSNVLVASDRLAGATIKTSQLRSTHIEIQGEYVRAGAGVSLQLLLRTSAEYGLGGMEYLQSVPGNIGGAICMNAGRGRKFNRSISDHVCKVEIFDGKRTFWISNDECKFGYRDSIFQERREWIIVGAELKLKYDDSDVIKKLLRERMVYSIEYQDLSLGNAGTVYKHDYRLSSQLMGYTVGCASFSNKVSNWINVKNDGSWQDVIKVLDHAEKEHLDMGLKRPTLEWDVWS